MLTPAVVRADSLDFQRVRALPARAWQTDTRIRAVAEQISAEYRKEPGAMLRDVQAAALVDAWNMDGLIAPILPGGGKTLLSFMLATLFRRKGRVRPLLVVPGGSILEKTERDFETDSKSWKLIKPAILSYEKLQRKHGAAALAEINPDLVILDECQELQDSGNTAWKKLRYFMSDARPLLFCLSASLGSRSPMSYWHMISYSLREHSPMPLDLFQALAWHGALGDKIPEYKRIDPSPLRGLWVVPSDLDDLEAAQEAYGQRFVHTPGVVASIGTRPEMGFSVEVRQYPTPLSVAAALEHMHKKRRTEDDKVYRETPDGYVLTSDIEVYQRDVQLETGWYYVWDPPAPEAYREARRAWAIVVSDIIGREIPGLESEELVKLALQREGSPYYGLFELWDEWDKRFRPNTVARWVDRTALEDAAAWLRDESEGRGVCWVDFPHTGRELARLTGLPFFWQKGNDAQGNNIEQHRGSCIASMDTCSVGLNLQHWFDRMYCLGMHSVGDKVEQMLGRIHRPGQKHDVRCVIPYYTPAKLHTLRQAITDSYGSQRRTCVPKKLAYADWSGDVSEIEDLIR
jgi:hypothetical protein